MKNELDFLCEKCKQNEKDGDCKYCGKKICNACKYKSSGDFFCNHECHWEYKTLSDLEEEVRDLESEKQEIISTKEKLSSKIDLKSKRLEGLRLRKSGKGFQCDCGEIVLNSDCEEGQDTCNKCHKKKLYELSLIQKQYSFLIGGTIESIETDLYYLLELKVRTKDGELFVVDTEDRERSLNAIKQESSLGKKSTPI